MSEFPKEILKLLELAGKKGSRPLDRLEKDKPLARGREAVAQASFALLAQSALYIYFDCFKEAHAIAQENEGIPGNWLHAILHRREPDAWNSKYWYARVKIPAKVSQAITLEALNVLRNKPPQELESFQKKLAKSGEWEPEAFVNLCDKVRKEDSDSPTFQVLIQIQEIEWENLLNYILASS